MSAVRVEVVDYVRSHGKTPRGYGSWAFAFDRHATVDDMHWEHQSTYADAKAKAKAKASSAAAKSKPTKSKSGPAASSAAADSVLASSLAAVDRCVIELDSDE